ncbi:protein WALLS ARE THIN 1-like [Curcuma longa]|uniref:protein WALLS ARE THIN 1-like n=1 Tax=Curcuma longa TaxID=136217 RepID=UPI003D9E3CFC
MADANGAGKRVCGMPEKVQLHVAMLALQFGYAGFHIVSRTALNMGTSKLVYSVYRNVIALILLFPFAYFLEKKDRPTMKLSFLAQFFLLALCGMTASQGFYLLGLENTSPTFASAIQNSIPAITFAMAVALRIEKVQLDRRDGIAKVAGTLACVGGATVITLYKGPSIFDRASATTLNSMAEGKNWTLGCVYLIGHCLSSSAWLVLQKPVLKKYPAMLSVTSFTCFFGLLQFLVIAAFIEHDADAWAFHSTGELCTILYAGIVASGISFAVQTWCIDRSGPVFVAVYQPVQTLVVAIMASIALGEKFYLGSIIGAVFIVVGLYLVLWGKSQERIFATEEASIISSNCVHDGLRPTAASLKASPNLAQPLLPSSTSESV